MAAGGNVARSLDPVLGICDPVAEYEKIGKIGAGTYGTVYKARHKPSGELVALKRVILHNEKADGFPATSLREMRLLRRLNHPNVVRLRDVLVGRKRESVFLAFEFCETDLAVLVDQRGSTPLPEAAIKRIMLDLFGAVAHMHDNWAVHRDVKMSNLLYKDGRVLLGDLGLAREFSFPERPLTPNVVSLWYRAPEVLLGATQYGPPIDLWSCGCVLGELLRNKPLFPGRTDTMQLSLIFGLVGSPSREDRAGLAQTGASLTLVEQFQGDRYQRSHLEATFPRCSPQCVDLLASLLRTDPSARLSAQDALRHPWFREFPAPADYVDMPGVVPAGTAPADALGSQAAAAAAAAASAATAAGTGK